MTKIKAKAKVKPPKNAEADDSRAYEAGSEEVNVDDELTRLRRHQSSSDTTQVYEFLAQCRLRVNAESEKALILEYQNSTGNQRRAALDQIIRAFARYAFFVAYRYRGLGLSAGELLNESLIALMKGADRFDVNRGVRFTTYSGWWVWHEVQRAVRNTGRLVRIPIRSQETALKAARAANRFRIKYSREPTEQELVQAIRGDGTCSGKRTALENLRRALQVKPEVSMDTTLAEREDCRGARARPIAEVMSNGKTTPEDQMMLRQQIDLMEKRLFSLTSIEAYVLRSRFGLGGDGREKTLREIGDEFHLSRERIRQLERQALAKMRHKKF